MTEMFCGINPFTNFGIRSLRIIGEVAEWLKAAPC